MKYQVKKMDVWQKNFMKAYNEHPFVMDSFYEDHLFDANFYGLYLEEELIGLTAIYKESLMTFFYVYKTYQHHAQSCFQEAMKLEQVREALTPTGNELWMSLCLDRARSYQMQAYQFVKALPTTRKTTLEYRMATLEDMDEIRRISGDFFDRLEERVQGREIIIGVYKGVIASFGIMEESRLFPATSIGMFVNPKYRQRGFGADTLRILQELVQEKDRKPLAGCYYYNHNSKKTLEQSGMVSHTRLVRFSL